MPPRKSNVSTISNGAEEGAETTPAKAPKEKDGISVEDLSLPKSMVARLAKGVLPANTSIQKDALLALHKSATVFVNYIASQANENTQAAGKKTIMPPDVMTAMKDAEFESFIPRLEEELKKYNETQCDKRNTYRRKVKEEKAAAAAKEGDDATSKDGPAAEGATEQINGQTNGYVVDEDVERPFKKFKAQNGAAVAPDADAMDETEETIDQQDDDADDQQEDEAEDDEQAEDEPEEEGEDDEAEDDDRDDLAAAAGLKDEALDEPGSDSD